VQDEIRSNYQDVMTRIEFCHMAVRFVEHATGKNIDSILAQYSAERNQDAFTDTNDPDILAAFALGITSGTGNNKFTPNGKFNREQAARMLLNVSKVISGIDVENAPPSGFADIGNAADWAIDAIDFCFANEIMRGTGNNMFSPKATYTREQSIVTFDRISLG